MPSRGKDDEKEKGYFMALPLDRLRSDVRLFVALVVTLTLIGVIFIYSSSSIFALEKYGSASYFLKKQFIYLVPSIGAFFLCALVPLTWWRKNSPWLFLGSLALTAVTLIPALGVKFHGSHRWLSLFGFSFQPSEILKLFLFMYMGFFLERKHDKIKSFLHTYLPLMLIFGITFVILLKQPDFGSVVTIMTTALMLFFVAEFRMIYLLVTALAACPIVVYLIMSKSYRLRRILIFLNPWADPQGSGFQIIQSLIAIGSGHIWGVGLSNSKQKFFYLPMQHTDFIFPIIAEEVGFAGVMVLLILYALFCFFGMRIAVSLHNPFAFFTSLAYVIFISLQAVINLMVCSGLLPTKGLGLPFISYGGTALMCFWAMVGFIVNSARAERS
jgi:cell division protein FtsW